MRQYATVLTGTVSEQTQQYTEAPASAATATLARLGWPALCDFVARFASTTLGRQQCQQLYLPEEHELTEQLVLETAAVNKLESEYAIELDFGGASTQQVSARSCAAVSCLYKPDMLLGLLLSMATAAITVHATSHASRCIPKHDMVPA